MVGMFIFANVHSAFFSRYNRSGFCGIGGNNELMETSWK